MRDCSPCRLDGGSQVSMRYHGDDPQPRNGLQGRDRPFMSRKRGEVMVERRVVVVTGASAGVGRATVRAFARRRASIALLARDPGRLEETRREVEAAGGRALVLP